MKGFNTRLPEFTIGEGGKIPCCGIGTFGLNEKDLYSLFCNYKYSNMLLDTASKYNNEKDISTTLKNTSVDRENIFITGKISFVQQQNMTVRQALYETLEKMNTDYLDLYLIHSPKYDDFVGTWRQLVEMQSERLVRHIGVSNFTEQDLREIWDCTGKWPEVNQITVNPFAAGGTNNLIKFCQERNILVESAAPFGGTDMKDRWNTLQTTRGKYLLYLYKLNIVSIPGTRRYEHMLENLNVFSNEITR